MREMQYKYLTVHKETGDLILLLPLMSGGASEIGTDNTCRTVQEWTDFWGIVHAQTAVQELEHYQAYLISECHLSKHSQQHSAQIQNYLIALAIPENEQVTMSNYSYARYGYSEHLFTMQQSNLNNNLYVMHLCPSSIDPLVATKYPLFSLPRTGNSLFVFELLTQLQKLKPRSKQDILIEYITTRPEIASMPLLTQDADLTLIKETLQEIAPQFFTIPEPSFNKNRFENNQPITLATIRTAAGYHKSASVPLSDAIRSLIHLNYDPTFIFSISSPFDTINITHFDYEKCSILVQFLLAEINIFCAIRHNMWDFRKNFGKILEGPYLDNTILRQQLSTSIRGALTNETAVEETIFQIINENRQSFELRTPLSETDCAHIKQKFLLHYLTIRDAPHFDDFTILDPDKSDGLFFNFQNRICCIFEDFLQYVPTFLQHESTITSHFNGKLASYKSFSSPMRQLISLNQFIKESKKTLLDHLNDESCDLLSLATYYFLNTNNRSAFFTHYHQNPQSEDHPRWNQFIDALLSTQSITDNKSLCRFLTHQKTDEQKLIFCQMIRSQLTRFVTSAVEWLHLLVQYSTIPYITRCVGLLDTYTNRLKLFSSASTHEGFAFWIYFEHYASMPVIQSPENIQHIISLHHPHILKLLQSQSDVYKRQTNFTYVMAILPPPYRDTLIETQQTYIDSLLANNSDYIHTLNRLRTQQDSLHGLRKKIAVLYPLTQDQSKTGFLNWLCSLKWSWLYAQQDIIDIQETAEEISHLTRDHLRILCPNNKYFVEFLKVLQQNHNSDALILQIFHALDDQDLSHYTADSIELLRLLHKMPESLWNTVVVSRVVNSMLIDCPNHYRIAQRMQFFCQSQKNRLFELIGTFLSEDNHRYLWLKISLLQRTEITDLPYDALLHAQNLHELYTAIPAPINSPACFCWRRNNTHAPHSILRTLEAEYNILFPNSTLRPLEIEHNILFSKTK